MRTAHRSLAGALLLTCILVSTAFAQDATAPPEDDRTIFAREQRESIRTVATEQKAVPPRPIDSLIRLDLENGRLTATLVDPNTPESQVFARPDDPDMAFRLDVQRLSVDPPVIALRQHFIRFDPATTRAMNVELLTAVTTVNLSITHESLAGTTTVQLIENASPGFIGADPSTARLYLQRDAENETNQDPGVGEMNFVEGSFAEIIDSHHDDAVAMLGEGLTAIRGMHVLAGIGQKEAAAIFDAGREVTDATKAELTQLVERIRNDGSAALDEARPRLRKLGASAAAELARMPREGWSADLALNVDALTAGLLPSANEQSAGLLSSPSRLVDLLYSPSPDIRRDAHARLEKLLRRTIELDVTLDPYDNASKIESLRPSAAVPTTQTARE